MWTHWGTKFRPTGWPPCGDLRARFGAKVQSGPGPKSLTQPFLADFRWRIDASEQRATGEAEVMNAAAVGAGYPRLSGQWPEILAHQIAQCPRAIGGLRPQIARTIVHLSTLASACPAAAQRYQKHRFRGNIVPMSAHDKYHKARGILSTIGLAVWPFLPAWKFVVR
jgi:hypothetical protein